MWGLRPAFASAPTCCCREWRLPFADDCFEVVYTEGQLRRWRDPCPFLRELLRVVRPGGCLLLHDLRRDADAYVTEYLVREMAAEAKESEDVRFLLRHFLLCLRASHSAGELEDLLLGLDGGGLAWQLDQTNEMSLTAIVEKRP